MGKTFKNKRSTHPNTFPIRFGYIAGIAGLGFVLALSSCGGGGGSGNTGVNGSGSGGGTYNAPSTRTNWAFVGSTVAVGDDNEAPLQWMVHDRVHNTLFLSLPGLNKVVVYDAVSQTLKASIDVSFPLAIDLSADSQSLYVGSGAGFLFVIDTSTLHVKEKINTSDILPGGFAIASVFVLGDGRLLFLPSAGVDGSSEFLVWDRTSGAVKSFSAPADVLDWGAVTISGDRSKVFLGGIITGAPVKIFDVNTEAFSSLPYETDIVARLAANPAKDQFAATDLDGNIEISDSGLHSLAGIRIEPPGQIGGQRLNGMVFSEDGTTLYLLVDSEIQAYDTQTFKAYGYMGQPFLVGAPAPFAADSSGMIYGTNIDGLDFIDASLTRKLGVPADPYAGVGGGLAPVTPDSAPLSGNVNATSNYYFNAATPAPSNVTAFIGRRSVSNLTINNNGNLKFTIPPGVAQGPTDFLFQLSDGTIYFEPKAFTYGPATLQAVTAAGTPDGGGKGFLTGYGLDVPSLHISVGGQDAAITGTSNLLASVGAPSPTSAGSASFTLPPGSASTVADVTVTTADGSTSLSKSLRFVGTPVKHPLKAAPEQGVYDNRRHLIYYTAGGQVQVLSTDSGQWQTPITVPSTTTAKLFAISLSPDGNTVAVGDQGNRAIVLFNPDSPASSIKAFAVPDGGEGLEPAGLAVTNQQKVYFLLSFPFGAHGVRCQNDNFYKLDGSTGTLTDLSIQGGWCVPMQSRVLFNPDQSLIYVDAGGALKLVTTSDSVVEAGGGGLGISDMTVSQDFTRLFQSDVLFETGGEVVGAPAQTESEESQPLDLRWGQKLDRYGSIVFNPWSSALDIVDLGALRNRERIALSFQAPLVFDSLVWVEDTQHIFVSAEDGVWEIPIGPLPLVLGRVAPASVAAGSVVTLNGNGFENGMSANVNDASAPITVVDTQTATLTVPAGVSGMVHITVRRADGASSTLEAAFVVGTGSQGIPKSPTATRSYKPLAGSPALQPSRRPRLGGKDTSHIMK